jgi:hypothetical protein
MNPVMDGRTPGTTGRPSGDVAEKTGQVEISEGQSTLASEPWEGRSGTSQYDACAPAQLVVGAVLGAPGSITLRVAPCWRCGGEHYYDLPGFEDLRPGERMALCDAPGPAGPGPAGPPGACGRCARIVPAPGPAVYYDAVARVSREGRAAMRRIRRLGLPTSNRTLADLRVMALLRARPKARRKLRQYLDVYIEYNENLVYPNFPAAAAALCQFIAATGLPIPTIVDTSTTDTTGITARWRLDEPLDSATWERAARRLQRRCRWYSFWPDVIGDLSATVRPPAVAHVLVEGDGDPRAALAVRPRRQRR